MITQKFKQGNNEIIIESAETLEDAEKNGFPQGVYSRFSINGKQIQSYLTLVKFIAEETKKNKNPYLLQNKDELMEHRKKMILQEREEIKKQYEAVKTRYGKTEHTEQMLKLIDEMIEKVDEYGIRVIK